MVRRSAYGAEISSSLLAPHGTIKVLFDQITVTLQHHSYVKYFDIMLNCVCFAVVHTTFWLKDLCCSWLDAD